MIVYINNRAYRWTFTVIEGLWVDAIIGRDFLKAHNVTIDFGAKIVNAHSISVSSVNLDEELDTILKDFGDLFSNDEFDIGRTQLVEHSIDVGNSTPVAKRYYRLPKAIRAEQSQK